LEQNKTILSFFDIIILMYKKFKAFTLIELLVVIAIVGILTGFIFVSMNGAVNSAKDAKKKADLGEIERMIMAYQASTGTLPSGTNCVVGTCLTELVSVGYLGTLPTDTTGGSYIYNNTGSGFTLSGTLSTGSYMYNSATNSWGNGYSYGQYKEQITISSAAGAPANYPVKLIINASNVGTTPFSHIRSDFADLRFTDSDGTTQIPYWIESFTAGTTATVWVQVPSISSGATIYMYYGTQTSSTSNGVTTFDFFDDFSASTLDLVKWTPTGTPTISSGICTVSGGAGIAATSGYKYGLGYAFRTLARIGNNGGTGNYESINFNSSPGCSYIDFGNGGSTNYSANTYNGSNAQATNIGASGAYPSYGVWEIRKISSTNSSFYFNNSFLATDTNYINTNAGGVLSGTAGTGFVYLDWVLVRKFISTEPSSFTFGSESGGI
jgi:prepilin-type N-terminal cleavage/methylation domain-containing protein